MTTLVACAESHPCEEPTRGLYFWHTSASEPSDCLTVYIHEVDALAGDHPAHCSATTCGGAFTCPADDGALVYDVDTAWEDGELVGGGAVTRLDEDGVEVCAVTVDVLAWAAE